MTKAQTQRLWAQMAAERWRRTLAARKGAATRKRKALAIVERQYAAVQLDEALSSATSELIQKEAKAAVERLKTVLDEPAITMAEQARHRAAFSDVDKEIARLKEGKLHPSEVVSIKHQAQAEVVLGKEMAEQAVLDFYELAKASGKIERISRHHKPGTTVNVRYRERHGTVSDRRSGKLLSEENLEDTLWSMMGASETVGARNPGGKLYATFSYFEYGKDVPRSGYVIPLDKKKPEAGSESDLFGQFYQSFDGTSYLGGAEDRVALEAKLRLVLEHKLKESAGKNTVVLVGYQLKSYTEHSEEQRVAWDRTLWRRLKAAQRKAEKLKAKPGSTGEVPWVDLETLKKDPEK